VLTSSVDGDARSWTLDGRSHRIFRAHVSTVSEAAFSRDGRWVVTAGPSTAGLFQARTGRWMFFIRGHTAPVRAASFSPDGRRILTASNDGTVRLYRCQICGRIPELRAMARARLAQIARPKATS
jgi:WD40 repeat protein